jgi:hypothetical protein
MNFVGAAQPLSPQGLSTALQTLGLQPTDAAYIWAIAEVETAGVTQGFGFRPDRRPQILFERHKFRDFTGGQFNEQAPDISGPPGGYGPLAAQYTRLEKAIGLCETHGLSIEPALKATSWGMGQVMGFNHVAAGFQSAAAMVNAFKESEDSQVLGQAAFLVANDLDESLREEDWQAFAFGYNGPRYWQNQYDVKLAQQFQRFSTGSLPDLFVRTAQAALLILGHQPGKIDGVLGNRTRGAVKRFKVGTGLPNDDALDTTTFERLCTAAGFSLDHV